MSEARFDNARFPDTLFRQKRKHDTWRVVAAPALEGALVDTHAHVQMLARPDFALARCAAHRVSEVCDIVDIWEDGDAPLRQMDGWLEAAAQVVEAWRANEAAGGEDAEPFAWPEDPQLPQVCFSVGCHPHNAKNYDEALHEKLRCAASDERVIAIGEIGLDYHYDLSPREDQRRAFAAQVQLAKELGLPVALHIREAHDEAFALLNEVGFPPAGTLLHCFNLDRETLRPWVDAGCYIAFGGPLTFKKADDVRDAALVVPRDRLLTETDAPYMTPEPMRGTVCEPAHVVFTADRMASVLGCETEVQRRQLFAQLRQNALTFFGAKQRISRGEQE